MNIQAYGLKAHDLSRELHITGTLTVPLSEINFRTSRSGGPGGQNVNKVESRVELLFDVERSTVFSDEQRERIFTKLKNKIDSEGILHITSQASRSQWENKEIALDEFARLLRSAIKPPKKRFFTKPSKTAKEKRLKKKKIHSEKKRLRRRSNFE